MPWDDPYRALTLLIDGKEAFPAILSAIAAAKERVDINMFIWRNDAIGREMAAAVLAAADRGVAVTLSVDRYGVVLEKCEECRRSFFHKRQTWLERLKSAALACFYPPHGAPRVARDVPDDLYRRLLSHPHITVSADVFKADHSKYYVIDEKILFLGGINIEDKENGRDMQGRVYQDYMMRLEGETYVAAFREKQHSGCDVLSGLSFGINQKRPVRRFEMEERYLSLINGAERELHITMAYFSPLPRFLAAILAAAARGVAVTVMIPQKANFQSDTNYKTVRTLLEKSGGRIAVCLSPKMLHTKLLASEKEISFGSTNITKKAFSQLDELNVCMTRQESAFCNRLLTSVWQEQAAARRVTHPKELRYRRLYAFFEGFLV